jgi:hypothetical protein
LKDTHPLGKIFKYDQPLSSLGIGVSMNRPDVIDPEMKLIWELKPISHQGGTSADYLQITKYAMETGYCVGDPKELVPIAGTKSYPIIDYRGNYRDVYLTPGVHGFIYYSFGPPEPTKVKKIVTEVGKATVKGAAYIITGTTLIIVGTLGFGS